MPLGFYSPGMRDVSLPREPVKSLELDVVDEPFDRAFDHVFFLHRAPAMADGAFRNAPTSGEGHNQNSGEHDPEHDSRVQNCHAKCYNGSLSDRQCLFLFLGCMDEAEISSCPWNES